MPTYEVNVTVTSTVRLVEIVEADTIVDALRQAEADAIERVDSGGIEPDHPTIETTANATTHREI